MALLVTVYGVTFGLLVLLDLSALQYGVALLVLAVAVGLDPLWRQRDRVLRWHNHGWSWSVDGAVVPVELLGWRIFAGVTLLSLRTINGPGTVRKTILALFPDSAPSDQLKCLRRILFADNNVLPRKV